MIKAIIFDVGGVLVKWDSNWVIDELVKFFGKSRDKVLSVYGQLIHIIGRGEIDEKEFWNKFIKNLGIKEKISLPKESLLLTGYRKNFKINKDIFGIVVRLRSKGYKTAILSDTNIVHARFTRKMGVFKGFNPVILSHEVGLRKPDPKIYKITLKKLRVKPEEAVFIDDVKDYVEKAKKLGMKGVALRNSKQLKRGLRKLGVPL